jgi:hypothetical protein
LRRCHQRVLRLSTRDPHTHRARNNLVIGTPDSFRQLPLGVDDRRRTCAPSEQDVLIPTEGPVDRNQDRLGRRSHTSGAGVRPTERGAASVNLHDRHRGPGP